MSRQIVLLLIAILLLPAIASASPATDTPVDADDEAPAAVTARQNTVWAPPGAGTDGFTWVQLVSGEWVKGEIKDLRDGNLSFDSDELDLFEYDWADVLSVISSAPHTVTTWDKEVHTGFIVASNGDIEVFDGSGAVIAHVSPDQVSSMIQGEARESNFWSGKLSVGSTVRSGNSDQSDANMLVKLNRRALVSRFDNTLSVNAANSDGSKTQESVRYTSKYDRFFTRDFFVTVPGYEYFHDRFQNIAQRHSPSVGLGYDQKIGPADWDTSLGAGWQYIEYESVAADQDLTDKDWVLRLGTNLEWDITSDLEFDLNYSIFAPVDEFDRYSHNMLSELSLDVWWDFEFDFTFAWDRQNKPQEAEDGTTPEKDDFRLTTGIGWDF